MSDPLTAEAAEFYETLPWCVHRITEAIALPPGDWLDPCVGEGAIPRAVNRADVRWVQGDIRATTHIEALRNGLHVAWWLGDYLAPGRETEFKVAMFNPPFSKALAFAMKALTHCRHVVMLQRLNWLQGPKERTDWLRENPPGVYVLPDRPSFSGDGKTDGGGYAWFVWPPQHATVQILASTPKSQIDEARYPSLKRQTALDFAIEGAPV